LSGVQALFIVRMPDSLGKEQAFCAFMSKKGLQTACFLLNTYKFPPIAFAVPKFIYFCAALRKGIGK